MEGNILLKAYNWIKEFLVYAPPQEAKPFVLGESAQDRGQAPQLPPAAALAEAAAELRILLDGARRLAELLSRARAALEAGGDPAGLAAVAKELQIFTNQQAERKPVLLAYNTGIKPADRTISANLEENRKILGELYGLPENKDLVLRPFCIPGSPPKQCLLVFLDGMIDKKLINEHILKPLMASAGNAPSAAAAGLMDQITREYLPSNQARPVATIREMAEGINLGDTALLIDGLSQAVLIETKGYEHRSISRPEIEQSVRGSQSAFSETLRVNTGLIRTLLPTSDLVTEMIPVGKRVPVNCAIVYMRSIANRQLVREIKRRLNGISTDYIANMGILEQFIEDHPSIIFPQALSTERPDRVAVHLLEGRVAIILDGTPFAHIVPVNFFTFFHTVEDFSLKQPAGAFMRVLRLFGTLLSVILPASYLAISYFHQEALPTDLALAIAGARERVPFPALLEVFLMEFSFELIREAGLRIPGMLGSTVGIVGAIILGQAAVAANLVSPIMVVLIAITGLASFAIPDYRLAFAFRLSRFIFLFLGAMLGLVGVAFGLALVTVMLCSMRSFGVPYMAPVGPKTIAGLDVIVRGQVFRQERRPDELNPQDSERQPHISRKWTIDKATGKDGDQ